jgi:hypothetical protein
MHRKPPGRRRRRWQCLQLPLVIKLLVDAGMRGVFGWLAGGCLLRCKCPGAALGCRAAIRNAGAGSVGARGEVPPRVVALCKNKRNIYSSIAPSVLSLVMLPGRI